GFLPGCENEAVDVGAEAQRIDLELPLIAMRGCGGRRKTVDGQILGGSLVDIFHPAGIEIVSERLLRRHPHDIEAHRLRAALAHADYGLRGVVEVEVFRCGEGETEFWMQEAPAANESLARILAIADVVDFLHVSFAIAFAALGGGVLPRIGLRILDPLRRS